MIGVQTDNEDNDDGVGDRIRGKGYKSTDVSTATEITPLKTRTVQEPPPPIQEVKETPRKKIKKKPKKKAKP